MRIIKTTIAAMSTTIVLGSCSHLSLIEGAQNIAIVESVPATCLKIKEERLSSAPIDGIVAERARENLTIKARNKAAEFGADKILVENNDHGLINIGISVEYYACGLLSELSDEILESACKLDQPAACDAIARRAQAKSYYAKMLDYFRKACAMNYKESCDWIANFGGQKAKLKKACIARDAESCFSAAKLADVETDYTLMMTFLKQGCSYGHSESCFYQNYAQEEKERVRESRDVQYQQYMANMQSESLRQAKFMATMAVLNYQAQVIHNSESK